VQPKTAEVDPGQLAAAREHYWIQYRAGEEWTDLDPDAVEGKPGIHMGSGDPQTIDCPSRDLASQLPGEMFHQVVFRVTLERWQDGNLQEEAAVESSLRTWNAPARHVYLSHVGFDGKAQSIAGLDPAALKAALLAQKRWRPVLSTRGRGLGPKWFDE